MIKHSQKPQQQFSYYDNDNTHGEIGWQRAAHGQRTTTAGQSNDSEICENLYRESERERERDSKRVSSESTAPEFSTAAPATMRMCKQSRAQNNEGGKTPARESRHKEREREIYIGQLPTLTHTFALLC